LENGAAAFEQKRPTSHSADQERIAYLQKKIQTKDDGKVNEHNGWVPRDFWLGTPLSLYDARV
jgi:hypothetical protein